MTLGPWEDVGYIALGGASLAVGSLALSPPTVNVAPLDGLGHRAFDATWDTTSTVVLVGGMTLGLGFAWGTERIGSHRTGWDALRAPLILGEAALMASGIVNVVKNIVGECRPRSWRDATQTCVPYDGNTREEHVAFPSGHTAPLAAMAGASLGMMLLPTHTRAEYLPLTLVMTALAGTNLVARELAGAHTFVDTTAGFVLGAGVGFATAALHVHSLPVTVGLSPVGEGIEVSGRY